MHVIQSRQQFARRVLTQGYNRTAHALIAGCNTVKIPLACKVLYSNWHSYYVKDPQYKHHYRAASGEPTKEGYVVLNQDSDRPLLRFQGKVCVPAQLVDNVLRAVHSFAHSGVEKSRGLFDRRYICLASGTGTRTEWTDRVSKAIGACHVCGPTKVCCGLHSKSFHELPLPSHVFSDVSKNFFDLPPIKHPYSGEMVEIVFSIVDRLTGYVLAIPCQKQGYTSKWVAERFLSRCAFFVVIPDRIMIDNASIINSDFFNSLPGRWWNVACNGSRQKKKTKRKKVSPEKIKPKIIFPDLKNPQNIFTPLFGEVAKLRTLTENHEQEGREENELECCLPQNS